MRPIVMRSAVALLVLQSTTAATAQKITMNTRQENLKSVLKQLEGKSKYKFLYADEAMAKSTPVTINMENSDFKAVVTEIFRQQPFSVEFTADAVIINSRALPQEVTTIQGKISAADDKNGLSGVTLRLTGKNYDFVTVTDAAGFYTFYNILPGKYQLTASYLGYRSHTQSVSVGREEVTTNIQLTVAEKELDQVVVVGYGSTQQRDVTSSVSKISGDKLQDFSNNATTFESILGGAAKGVMVTQNSGEPGSTAKLNIRGITSPVSGSSNEPLYVIDGVPFFIEYPDINPLSNIPVSEIESIDILKDAAATAIYGSRGANGVVIVNTKRGKRNAKFSVNADYTHSLSNPIKNYKPLSTTEFKQAQTTLITNTIDAINKGQIDPYEAMYVQIPALESFATISPDSFDDFDTPLTYKFEGLREDAFGKTFTDWNKVIQNKNARTSQFNVSLTGGNENHNMSFNFNTIDQDGLFINDNLKRYSGRVSFDSNISRHLKVGSSLGYSVTKRHDGESMFTDGNTKTWLVRPDILPYTESGDFNRIDGTGSWGYPVMLANPLAQRQNKNNSNLGQFLGSAYAEVEVLKNLKLRSDISISSYQSEGSLFSPKVAQDDLSILGSTLYSSLYTSSSKNTNTSLNFRGDYTWATGHHHFKAMAGFGYDRYFLTSGSVTYDDFPDDDVLTNEQSAARVTFYNSSKLDRGLNSIYSRLNYKYGDRYLAEVNFRTDQSSKFGPGNQRAYFPSVSLGWRVSNEKFLADVSAISDLKLRASWGNTGSTNINDFLYRQFFIRASNNLWGGRPSVVLENTLPNRDVKWEKTREYNLGLDFGFFDNRLFGSFDVYNRYTEGALSPAPAPLESGFKNFYSNLIDLSNRGFELELGYEIIRSQDFGWTASFNLSRNKNRIEHLNGANISAYQLDSFIEGQPAGTLKGYRVEKIFNDQAEIDDLNAKAQDLGFAYYQSFSTGLGDYKFADLNNDGRISTEDRTIIASPQPKFFGGLYSTMRYKNFGLSFVFQFSKGAQAMLDNLLLDNFGQLGQSIHRETFENMWTPENTNTNYARMVYYDPSSNMRSSDRYVYETSFLRLKNVNLSYNLPGNLAQRCHLQSLALHASMSNIFTITKWPGLDPELIGPYITTSTTNSDPYPLSKTFSFGVRATF